MGEIATPLPRISRLLIAALTVIGLAGILPVSLVEMQTGSGCPHLGPIPACHIVSIAYGLILISVSHQKLWKRHLFFWGWIPVFILAATGSGLELLGQDICPKTDNGWPKCYSSLILACVIFLPILFNWFLKRAAKAKFR